MATSMDQNRKLFLTLNDLSENKKNEINTRNKRRNKNQSATWLTYKPWF